MTMPCPTLRFGDVLAFHGGGFISWQIRRKTNGWCNHVAVCADDRWALESTISRGLHETLITELIKQPVMVFRPVDNWGPVVFTPSDHERAANLYKREQGSRYDWQAIVGFMFGSYRNLFNNPRAWFCSEWVDAWLRAAGVELFNGTADGGSISPTDVAIAGKLTPIWHRGLPVAISKHMRIYGVPCGD